MGVIYKNGIPYGGGGGSSDVSSLQDIFDKDNTQDVVGDNSLSFIQNDAGIDLSDPEAVEEFESSSSYKGLEIDSDHIALESGENNIDFSLNHEEVEMNDELKSSFRETLGIIDNPMTWEANTILGAKNLLHFPYSNQYMKVGSYNRYGLNWTVNNDGSVTYSGGPNTSTTGVNTRLIDDAIDGLGPLQPGKKYIISLKNPTPDNKIYLSYADYTNGTRNQVTSTFGDDKVITVSENADAVRLGIYMPYEYTFSEPWTAYPMIRLAEDTDSTYQPPYTMTNEQLSVSKAEQNEVDDISNVYGAKNLVPYPYYETTKTSNGVTWTDNGDGTITVSGTRSGTSYFRPNLNSLGGCIAVPTGKYILSLKGDATNIMYRIDAFKANETYDNIGLNVDLNTDTEFDYDASEYVGLSIRIDAKNDVETAGTFNIMLRCSSIKDDTWQPYAKTNYELTVDKAEHSEVDYLANKSGAKQLIPFPYSMNEAQVGEYESYGITYTVNKDGTVEANGTATNESSLNLYNCWGVERTFSIENNKTYILNGTPEGGGVDTYYLQLVRHKRGQTDKWVSEFGNGITISVTDEFTSVGVRILIKNGITCDHLVFKPMLRLASIKDDSYVPYAMTNKELTDNKVGWKSNGILGAKNLLPYPYTDSTMTSNGVTFTDNGDGSVTLNGTATAEAAFRMRSSGDTFKLKAGKYRVIQPENYSTNGVFIRLYNYDSGSSVRILDTNQSELTLDADVNKCAGNIIIRNGKTVSNFTVFPMIMLAEDTDDTYQPYAKTNYQLTNESATKEDLSEIIVTGSTNNSGSTIVNNTYFYKDQTLCQATANIATNATLTLNANYIEVNGVLNNITPQALGFGYGTCATAAATAAKVVTLSGYNLITNGTVSVKFTYDVPASATMNINSKGAKAIYFKGAAIKAGIIKAGDLVEFIYNGSQYHVLSIDRCSDSNAFACSTQLTNQDLNTVITPGFYNAGGGNTVTNKPTGVDHFGLSVVKRASGNYFTQTLYISGKSYKRYCDGNTSTWSDWVEDCETCRSFYGTCATVAATASKVVTLSDTTGWELKAGTIVGVKYTASNSASSCTLNVNDSGAKSIYYNTAVYTGSATTICGAAGLTIYYMYDGTNWVWMNLGKLDGNDNTIPSAYCSTAAATAAKVASCTNYTALAKSYVHVTITASNTSKTALTLNINSKGAKPIYINGTASSESNYTLNAGTYIVYYDGTNYYFRNDGKLTADITGSAESATTATKVGSSTVGGTTTPIYLNAGTPTALSYTIAKSVPSDAVFTDTIPSAYCDTAAATAAKTAVCTNYTALSKSYITVVIKTSNTSKTALTLNINGKGAKPIYINGAASSESNYTLNAGPYLVYYNGTNYYFRNDGKITTAGMVDIGGNTTKFFKGDGTLAVPSKSDVGLGNVDNTSDANKPVSTAQQTALNGKANENPTFTEASTRANIVSGESFATILGKIKKFFTDIKDLAFIAKDGTNSTKYLRGDGTWQAFSKSTVGLGSVDNTADTNKPVAIVDCSTARSTTAKVVALTGFTLKTGSHVYVRFTDTGTSNPASGNLTLNVNSTGAKTIVDAKTNKTALTYSNAGWFYNNQVHDFVYDGTYWVWVSRDNNTTYSTMSVSELTTGTATSARTVRADYLKTGINTLISGKADKTDIATVESGTTASRAYSVGELVYVSGALYKVKTAIASGATFTVGTNIEATNVSDVFGWDSGVTVNLNSGTATYQKHALLGLKRVIIISSGQPSTSIILTGKIPNDYIPVFNTLGTFYDNSGNSRSVLFYDSGNSGKMIINPSSDAGLAGEYLYW